MLTTTTILFLIRLYRKNKHRVSLTRGHYLAITCVVAGAASVVYAL